MTPRLPTECSTISHRLTQVPVRGDDDRPQGGHLMLSTLGRAHAGRRALVVAWVRTRNRGPLLVLIGGLDRVAGSGELPLPFPPGARGREHTQSDTAAALGALTWEPCQLALDAGYVVEQSPANRTEEIFALSDEAAGILVVARPLAPDATAASIDGLSDELAKLEALRTGRGVHRRRLARVEANLEYLDRQLGSGCWQLEVWTGGRSPAEAHGITGLLANTGDLAESPLAVRPGGAALASELSWGATAVVGTDVVAALVRPPFRELPGVRVSVLPDFDQNVEDDVQVRLGSVLDAARVSAAPFGLSLDSINRHVFVSGATGAGKSETVRSLLLSLNQRAIPWLVIEPAKAEYAAIGPWLDPGNPLAVIRPGDPAVVPPMLNPLEPSSLMVRGVRRTFPLQTHLDLVKALFTASFDADDPFPQVLSGGLTRAYGNNGWNLVTGEASDPALSRPAWPTLGDLVWESLSVVDGLGYGAEVRDNVRGFIRVRIESLRSGTPGRFFEGGFLLDLEDLFTRPAVFEVEDIGDDQDKAFFIGTLVIRLVEHLRLRQKYGLQPPGLSHVIVIEEAHRLLRNVTGESPAAHAVTMFANLLAEIRAYGEGVVVAEQIPSKVIPDLVKNSAVKIMHRLPAKDDRDAVGATMNLSEGQSAHVVALEPGTAVAHTAGMDRPVLVRIDRVSTAKQTGARVGEPKLSGRTPACAADCGDDRCTLATLAAARDLAGPAVALYAEQFVVAHLTSDRVGSPGGPWFEALHTADARQLRCAVGLAVTDATSRRAHLIRRWHDPSIFSADVCKRMLAQIASGRGLDRPPPKWTVGQFRTAPVRAALTDAAATGDRTRPHPWTARWQALGIDLPGPSWQAQLDQLDEYRRSMVPVRPAQLAGKPPVFDELATELRVEGASESARIATALKFLGLEYKWLVVRIGAKNE